MAHSSPEGVAEVVWRIVPATPPRIVRHCPRCQRARPFASTERFRINAQQRHLDVWLIYQCTDCEARWKRELMSRCSPEDLGDLYPLLLANDAETARRFGFEVNGFALESDDEVRIERIGAADSPLRIRLEVPFPCDLRLERLLAKELDLSRSRLRRLAESGAVEISPGGVEALQRAVRNGTSILVRPTA